MQFQPTFDGATRQQIDSLGRQAKYKSSIKEEESNHDGDERDVNSDVQNIPILWLESNATPMMKSAQAQRKVTEGGGQKVVQQKIRNVSTLSQDRPLSISASLRKRAGTQNLAAQNILDSRAPAQQLRRT